MARLIAERADALPALGEVFREYGFEGASLARITQATGLGKSSLYHFFPGGKEEMLAATLAHIDDWFETNMFAPLRDDPPRAAIAAMFEATDAYFRSGRRVCLIGVIALADTRDAFAAPVRDYFRRWIEALASALERAGHAPDDAAARAEAVVAGLQGAITLARAMNDTAIFTRCLERLRADLTI